MSAPVCAAPSTRVALRRAQRFVRLMNNRSIEVDVPLTSTFGDLKAQLAAVVGERADSLELIAKGTKVVADHVRVADAGLEADSVLYCTVRPPK